MSEQDIRNEQCRTARDEAIKLRYRLWRETTGDWWAHCDAHYKGQDATMSCTHLSGVCYGDGAELRERVERRYAEYQEILNALQ